MKTIAEQFFPVLLEDIINEKREQAELTHKKFNGLSGGELFVELEKKLGREWAIDNSRPHLSRSDVNAIANARFFKQTGQKLLMGVAIIILGLAVISRYLPAMSVVGLNLYYTFCGIIALGFVWIYSRKQGKVRRELRWMMGVKDTEEK